MKEGRRHPARRTRRGRAKEEPPAETTSGPSLGRKRPRRASAATTSYRTATTCSCDAQKARGRFRFPVWCCNCAKKLRRFAKLAHLVGDMVAGRPAALCQSMNADAGCPTMRDVDMAAVDFTAFVERLGDCRERDHLAVLPHRGRHRGQEQGRPLRSCHGSGSRRRSRDAPDDRGAVSRAWDHRRGVRRSPGRCRIRLGPRPDRRHQGVHFRSCRPGAC